MIELKSFLFKGEIINAYKAIRLFNQNSLSKEGLYACLQDVPYGYRIVAKTEDACKCIEIVDEHQITDEELEQAFEQSAEYRKKVKGIVERSRINYREGTYLQNMIDANIMVKEMTVV